MPEIKNVKSTFLINGANLLLLSIGMGCMTTYASYFRNDVNLTKNGRSGFRSRCSGGHSCRSGYFSFCFCTDGQSDTIISDLVAGGPGLLFITIPQLFDQMSLSVLWSTFFFVLLALAAITSTISLMEVTTIYLQEEYRISRKKATFLVCIGVCVTGTISCFSRNFSITGLCFRKTHAPIGGLFIAFCRLVS